MSFIEFVL